MSLDLQKTPLGSARGLGSAKDGTGHWWLQRVSAIMIIPVSLYLLLSFLGLQSLDHITISKWLAQPLVTATMLMFVLSMFVHAELGTQTVIEDYVHGKTKVVLLMLLKFIYILAAIVCVVSILKVSF